MSSIPRRRIPELFRPRVLACAAFLFGCGLWAFTPLEARLPPEPAPSRSTPTKVPTGPLPFNAAAFHTPVWISPAKEEALADVSPPPPPAPPVRFQLVAVIRGESGHKAVLYDPDADRLIVLGENQSSRGLTAIRLTPTSVDLSDNAGVRTLALRSTGEPAAVGEHR